MHKLLFLPESCHAKTDREFKPQLGRNDKFLTLKVSANCDAFFGEFQSPEEKDRIVVLK